MIFSGVTNLATLGQQWRVALRSSMLSARINPGSPLFASGARYLQEALAAATGQLQAVRIGTAQVAQMLSQPVITLTNLEHVAVAAVFGALSVFALASHCRFWLTHPSYPSPRSAAK